MLVSVLIFNWAMSRVIIIRIKQMRKEMKEYIIIN
jgi:hypothetical protein